VPDLTDRSRMAARRTWFLLRDLRWWAIAALVLGMLTVILALTGQAIETVQAVGALAIVTAVLATRET
jgi:hypothetical protein